MKTLVLAERVPPSTTPPNVNRLELLPKVGKTSSSPLDLTVSSSGTSGKSPAQTDAEIEKVSDSDARLPTQNSCEYKNSVCWKSLI